MSEDRFQLQRLLEAILFASAEPLTVDALAARMPEGSDIPGLLQEIRDLYANRGVNLTPVEDRWCFRTAPDLSSKFHIEQKVERKLTRAAVETMAIIAYHQPVTRAEIEEIRGVAISKGTLDNLLEAGWIKPKGRRQTPGRPVTWVTTEGFLEHFGLESCDALPGVEELRAAGLLDSTPNAATLGVQGHLPPGGGDGEGDEEDGDGEEGVVADDAYDAEMLARLEGGDVAAEVAAVEEAAGSAETDEDVDEGADDGDLDEDDLDEDSPEDAELDGDDDDDDDVDIDDELEDSDIDGEEDEADDEDDLEDDLKDEAFEEDVAAEDAAAELSDLEDEISETETEDAGEADDGDDDGDDDDGDDDEGEDSAGDHDDEDDDGDEDDEDEDDDEDDPADRKSDAG